MTTIVAMIVHLGGLGCPTTSFACLEGMCTRVQVAGAIQSDCAPRSRESQD